jgi:preprotein translocase SecE subunit
MKDIVQFINDVRLEFSKIVWPKWHEFVGSTFIVLFLVLVFALYLQAVDLGISWLTSAIYKWYGLS